jgi:hypothetical protein
MVIIPRWYAFRVKRGEYVAVAVGNALRVIKVRRR